MPKTNTSPMFGLSKTKSGLPAKDQSAVIGPLMTVAEVAAHLRESHRTTYRRITRGELPALHLGRSIRIARLELDRFLSQR